MVVIYISVLLYFVCLSKASERFFYLMGTYSTIDLKRTEDIKAVYKYMRSLEKILSSYIETSDISRINKESGSEWVSVSKETIEIIKRAKEISEKTYGYFDITVGSYTINYKRKKLLSERQAKSLINYKDILIDDDRVFLRKKGMAIDLGGLGKGYTLEKAYEYIDTKEGFLAIGGDFKIWGIKKPIAIKDPINNSIIAIFVNRHDLCVSTSGNYFQDHIITYDENVLQVTVLYTDCTYADAYATALLAMPANERKRFLKENKSVGVLIMYKDGNVFVNDAFLSYCDKFKLLTKSTP